MYIDSIVEEVHDARRLILAEYNGDIRVCNAALSHKEYPGFKFAKLEPVRPFSWNRGLRPTKLNAASI